LSIIDVINALILTIQAIRMFPHFYCENRRHLLRHRHVRAAGCHDLTCVVTNHARPLPNSATAAPDKAFLHASTLPNAPSIFSLSDAGGFPPPLGRKQFQ